MIDLHTHTGNGIARQKVERLLQRAEENKLTHLAISDHEGVDAYAKLMNPELRKTFSGKIIPAVELRFIHEGARNELLGYGIDVEKLSKSKLLDRDYQLQCELIELEQYHKLFTSLGVQMSDLNELKQRMITMAQNGEDYEDIRRVTGEDFFSDKNKTVREKLLEPYNGSFKVYATEKLKINWDYQPSMAEVSSTIRDAGGLVFMAHPGRVARYEGKDKMQQMLDFGTNNRLIDGIEIYRPDVTPEQVAHFESYGKKNKLLFGAGSDSSKEKEPLLSGISKEKVGNWIDEIKSI